MNTIKLEQNEVSDGGGAVHINSMFNIDENGQLFNRRCIGINDERFSFY